MFVGHYGAALALKGAESRASLGLLFLGVQFVDLLFFPWVLAGVERMNIVPGYTESTCPPHPRRIRRRYRRLRPEFRQGMLPDRVAIENALPRSGSSSARSPTTI